MNSGTIVPVDNPNRPALPSKLWLGASTFSKASRAKAIFNVHTDTGVSELLTPWKSGAASFRHRVYSSYENYVAHQAAKLASLDLRDYDTRYRAELRERLERLNLLGRGDTVLCLAARIGTECKAFIDLGCFAVGIDLNPGPDNAFVVRGDFHNLQFADESVNHVFTNSLDHAFDLERVLAEIVRVLKPGGNLIAEIVGGSKDSHGREPGEYESLWWDNASDVVDAICRSGLMLVSKQRFDYPWSGELVVFGRPVRL